MTFVRAREIIRLGRGTSVQTIRGKEHVFCWCCSRAADRKIKHERGYLGTVEVNRVVPYFFYAVCHLAKEHSDPRHGKDTKRRARAEKETLNQNRKNR